jgi:hypothetical protein
MRLREAVHPSRWAVMRLIALLCIEFILEKFMAAPSQAWGRIPSCKRSRSGKLSCCASASVASSTS